MKRLFLALACAAGIVAAPAAAEAALTIRFVSEDLDGGAPPPPTGVAFHPSSGVPHYFDLVFEETGGAYNEGLFSYDIGLRLVRPRPRGSPDLRLLTGAAAATIPPDNFVLPLSPPPSVVVLESDADHMIFNITSGRDLGDINTGDKAARVWYVVEPGTPEATYRLQFDVNNTVFGSADPNVPIIIHVDLSGEGVIITPEPSAPCLLAAAGLLALRRRRTMR